MNDSKRKKIHFVEDTCFVIIDKDIVDKLQLKQNDVWAEQSGSRWNPVESNSQEQI
jgi:hypothetical protein